MSVRRLTAAGLRQRIMLETSAALCDELFMPPSTTESIFTTVPETSSVAPISIAEIDSKELQDIVTIWNRWRGGRSMAARSDVAPKTLGRLVRNISLLRVLSTDEDYEFRITGSAHTQAYGASKANKRLSEVLAEAPGFGRRLKNCLDLVVETREPAAYRGKIGRDVGDARFVWLETVFLPLGDSDAAVDHILIATVYVPVNGIWPN